MKQSSDSYCRTPAHKDRVIQPRSPYDCGLLVQCQRFLDLAVAVAFCALHQGCAAQDGGGVRLELQAVHRVVVPTARSVRGVSPGAGHSLFVWFADGQPMILRPNGGYVVVDTSVAGSVLAARLDTGTGLVEVLDARGPSLVTIDSTGTEVTAETFEINAPTGALEIESGALSDSALALGAIDRSGSYWLLYGRNAPQTAGNAVANVSALFPTAPALTGHVSLIDERIVFTRLHHPFDVLWFDTGGRVLCHSVTELAEESAQMDDDSLAGWVSMATLPAGSGTLQTLADLRSDRRLVVTRDAGARPIQRTLLRLPLGFAFADPKAHYLLAVTEMNKTEIVRYSWSSNDGGLSFTGMEAERCVENSGG